MICNITTGMMYIQVRHFTDFINIFKRLTDALSISFEQKYDMIAEKPLLANMLSATEDKE